MTNSKHNHPVAPNVLDRQFTQTKPNHAWVGDITYVWTAEGWLYFSNGNRLVFPSGSWLVNEQ